jgi:hypothetical protein
VLQDVGADSEDSRESSELELLIGQLKRKSFEYELGSAGDPYRIAILYDAAAVGLKGICEGPTESRKFQNLPIFPRPPLFAHFEVDSDEDDKTDLAIVGISLAQGRDLTENHQRAMEELIKELRGGDVGDPPRGGTIPVACDE